MCGLVWIVQFYRSAFRGPFWPVPELAWGLLGAPFVVVGAAVFLVRKWACRIMVPLMIVASSILGSWSCTALSLGSRTFFCLTLCGFLLAAYTGIFLFRRAKSNVLW